MNKCLFVFIIISIITSLNYRLHCCGSFNSGVGLYPFTNNNKIELINNHINITYNFDKGLFYVKLISDFKYHGNDKSINFFYRNNGYYEALKETVIIPIENFKITSNDTEIFYDNEKIEDTSSYYYSFNIKSTRSIKIIIEYEIKGNIDKIGYLKGYSKYFMFYIHDKEKNNIKNFSIAFNSYSDIAWDYLLDIGDISVDNFRINGNGYFNEKDGAAFIKKNSSLLLTKKNFVPEKCFSIIARYTNDVSK